VSPSRLGFGIWVEIHRQRCRGGRKATVGGGGGGRRRVVVRGSSGRRKMTPGQDRRTNVASVAKLTEEDDAGSHILPTRDRGRGFPSNSRGIRK
jgi:hypothetical protein